MGVGATAKMGTDAASATVTEPFVFVTESVQAQQSIIDASGLSGIRGHQSERCREGTIQVGGNMVLEPTPAELAVLLPRILGGAPSGNNYPLGEQIPDFYLAIDRVSKVFVYAGVKIVRAVFSCSEGQAMQLSLDVVGKTETVGAAGTFPAIEPTPGPPFTMMDATFSFISVARSAKSFQLTIENTAETDRFLNSSTLTDIPINDRVVSLQALFPYTAGETDLYGMATGGVAASITLTNGGMSLGFVMPKLQVGKASPTVQGRGEIFLPINGIARRSGTTPELAVTLDTTP